MKIRKIYFNALILLIILPVFCFSAEMKDIKDKAKEKYGNKIDEITDITVKLTTAVKEMGMEVGMTWYFKGNKLRMENETMGISSIQLYDGNDFWIISPVTGKKKVGSKQAGRTKFLLQRDWWNENMDSAKIAGEENINGIDCYVVLENKGGKAMADHTLWIDKNSLLLIKDQVKNRDINIQNIYSDYKQVDGKIIIPFETETNTNAVVKTTMSVKSIDIKTAISDELFDVEKINVEENKEVMEELKKMMK